MKPLLLILILIIALISFQSAVSAQEQFFNYTYTNDIRCLAEEGDYIWIGTTNGLLKRDKNGELIGRYSQNEGFDIGRVDVITVGNGGVIWLGSWYNGITRFYGPSCVNFTTSNSGLCNDQILAMVIDEDENLWVGTTDGISVFNGAQDWTTITTENGLANNNVQAIAIDESGNKWFGTWGGGVSVYNDFEWITYTSNDGLADDYIRSMAIDLQGNIWVGNNEGVSMFDGSNWEVYNSGELPNPYVTSIAIDHQNNKWFNSEGLAMYDGSSWTHYTSEDGLFNNSVTSIIVDSENTKWVGQAIGGVTKYDDTNWSNFFTELMSEWVSSIDIDPDGNVLVGYIQDGGGVSIYDGDSWIYISETNWINVQDLKVDLQGNVWIGYFGGVAKYDGDSLTSYNQEVASYTITAIECDNEGNMWFGGPLEGGVTMYDGLNWTVYDAVSCGLASNYINTIEIDPEGNIWFGTTAGASKFDGINWTTYTPEDGLVDDHVTSVSFGEEGSIWFGTVYGVSKFDGTDWTTYTQLDGLCSNNITDITIDTQNNIWIGSGGSGVSMFNGTTWTSFNHWQDGLVSNSIKGIAIDANDNVWLATANGISIYQNSQSSIEKDFFNANLNIYPNPCLGFVNLEIKQPTSFRTSINIVNLQGTIVFTKEITNNSINNIERIDVSGIPKGIYLVKIKSDNNVYTQKILKL